MNIHGGPEGQSLPVFQGRHNYYLNELGIAIFYPNVRGSDGYGKTFLTLDNGFKREDSVKDIGAFLNALATDERLDAARFAVTGGSYGGYMSTASMVHFGDRLRCGIDVVGVADFLTFLANTSAYRLDLRRVEYGDERDPKMREFLVKISPSTHAAKIRKPLFIVQGKNDPRVPVSVAHSMRDAMKKPAARCRISKRATRATASRRSRTRIFNFSRRSNFCAKICSSRNASASRKSRACSRSPRSAPGQTSNVQLSGRSSVRRRRAGWSRARSAR